MSKLLDKLKKTSTVKNTNVLSESIFFNKKDITPTKIPLFNIALSGRLDGGLTSGLTVLAGPSKHFKTNFALVMASSFLKKHEDGVILLYDSEFGITPDYLKSMDVDPARVVHTPVEHVEMLKFDITKQLESFDRDDKVMIIIDSVGNLASKKELEDALNEKSVADMSRAKALKGLFRIVTPYLTTKNVPCIAVNHTYKEIGLFPKDVVGGGTGIYYSADTIFIIGRKQEKVGTEIEGYHFILNVEKSRFVKEKSKLPITVTWDGGINKWSGLLDLAIDMGYIKSGGGWYTVTGADTKVRAKDTNNADFWLPILKSGFADAIEKKFAIGADSIVKDEDDAK